MLDAKGVDLETAHRIVAALAESPGRADLSPVDRAMVDYALKLNDAPASIEAADVEVLRLRGFDDRAIHDLASIVAYFAFVNRIADGLGVELEPPSAEA